MAGDEALMAMVRRLSAISAADRSFVLAALDEAEARELERLTRELGERGMSQPLRNLVSDCADGAALGGVTERAVMAVRKAAASHIDEPAVALLAKSHPSLWDRFAARAFGG